MTITERQKLMEELGIGINPSDAADMFDSLSENLDQSQIEDISVPHITEESPRESYIEWYSKRKAMILKEKEVLASQHARRIAKLDAEMKGLDFFHKDSVDKIIMGMVGDKKKGRYYDSPYGRLAIKKTAGYVKIEEGDKFIAVISSIMTDEEAEEMIDREPRIDLKVVKNKIKYKGNGQYIIDQTGEMIDAATVRKLGLSAVEPREEVLFNVSSPATLDAG